MRLMKNSLKTTSFIFAFLGIVAAFFFLFQSLKGLKLEEDTENLQTRVPKKIDFDSKI